MAAALLLLAPFDPGPYRYGFITAVSLLALLLVLVIARQVLDEGEVTIPGRRLHLAALAFLAVVVLSNLYAVDRALSRYGTVLYGMTLGVLYALLAARWPWAAWRRLFQVLLAFSTAASVHGIAQVYLGGGAYGPRAHSIFVVPNTFAALLVLVLPPLALAWLGGPPSPWRRFGGLGLVLLHYAALLLSGSRGAWIGGVGGALALLIVLTWRWGGFREMVRANRGWLAALGVMLLLVTAVLLRTIPSESRVILGGRTAELFQPVGPEAPTVAVPGGWQARLIMWGSAWEVIRRQPILGTGIATYHQVYPQFMNTRFFPNEVHFFAHNDYLQFWAEVGALGTLPLLLFLGAILLAGLRAVGAPGLGPQEQLALGGALAGAVGLLLHSGGDFNLRVPGLLLLFAGYAAFVLQLAARAGVLSVHRMAWAAEGWAARRGQAVVTAAGLLLALALVHPYVVSLINQRGIARLKAGQPEEAARAFRLATRLDPVVAGYVVNLGGALLAQYRRTGQGRLLVEVETALRRGMALSPRDDAPYWLLAQLYLVHGGEQAQARQAEVGELLEQARRLNPGRHLSAYQVGRALLQAGLPDRAIGLLREAVRRGEAPLQARLVLAEAYGRTGQPAEGLAVLQPIARPGPDQPAVRYLTGQLLRQLGRYEEALAAFRDALAAPGPQAVVRVEIGRTLLGQGRVREAEAEFREALAANPRFVPALLGMGWTALRQGRRPEAAAAFRRALTEDPSQAFLRELIPALEASR
ncbi:MAG: tetratricopeptide repeat protein [Deltaproteobacteria bacterium]|nr:tetratricopeptide repeat protein [Deltaproteobacteria bacterium]